LLVRPGITGLAQMRLPADSDIHSVSAKLAHDLKYVHAMGPRLDVRIALSTLFYFLGWAGTAVSRRLVQPFAPSQPVDVPAVGPGLDFPVSGRGGGHRYTAVGHDALQRAA
jgi:hypothetical protein